MDFNNLTGTTKGAILRAITRKYNEYPKLTRYFKTKSGIIIIDKDNNEYTFKQIEILSIDLDNL